MACGTDRSGGAGGRPLKIKHLFGETTLSAPPRRVVSAGLTEHDDLLAVGVIPVAVTEWFGDQPSAVWPWARERLGPAKPVVLNLDNGIQLDTIAGLDPDLIVAVNAGLDSDTYQKLTAIAPTLAQSGGDAFFEPWKDQASAIGTAVFQGDAMTGIVDRVGERFAAVAQANPRFRDTRAVLLSGRFAGDAVTATVGGWRADFLTSMGFAIPESLTAQANTDGQVAISRDQLSGALDTADVLIWTTESDDERAALTKDPAVAGLRATSRNRNVFTTKDLAGAIAFGTPLSYPVVADTLPPLIGSVL